MFAWLFLWLVLGIWLIVGAFVYAAWKRRRHPTRHQRWWVLGMSTGFVGYCHTLAYGFALTQPTEICGQRTLDDDYPLTHVRVDAFPHAWRATGRIRRRTAPATPQLRAHGCCGVAQPSSWQARSPGR